MSQNEFNILFMMFGALAVGIAILVLFQLSRHKR